jgi:quinol monooxygenase YgiN
MTVIQEKLKEVMQTLVSMVEPTGKENGCQSYRVFQDIEDSLALCILEEWQTQEDLDTHIKSDRFSVLLGLKSLLSIPLQINFHTVSDSEGMEMVEAIRGNYTLIYAV